MKHSKHELSGIRLMLQASIAFSLMALGVKIASRSLPSSEIVFFRSLIGAVMIAAVIRAKKAPFLGTQRGIMCLRGLSGFAALTLYFYTLAHLPLGTAMMLNYTAPVFVALFAAIYLKEKIGWFLSAMLLMAFSGIYLLAGVKPTLGVLNPWNFHVMLGLLSAMCAAWAYIFIRKIKHRESPLTVIFYFTGISTVGSAFFLPLHFVLPSPGAWLALALVGVSAFYGQLWLTISLRRARASLVSCFSYCAPLLAFLYGWLFFSEPLRGQSLAGAGLIILAGCLLSLGGNRVGTAKSEKEIGKSQQHPG